MEELKKMHPQRNTFSFSHLTISSDFDSGNLARCEEGDEDGYVSALMMVTLIVQHVDFY